MIQRPNRGAAVQGPPSIRSSVSPRRLVFVVVGVMVGMLLAALDQTVVGTAMPRVIAELRGFEHYAWVATAYMLASTVSVPIYGKLSDIYGRRPFFLTGMVLFLLGSALSGISRNMTELILFRGLQGLGAGAMMPIAQAIIGDLFSPAERGKWQGLTFAVFGLATIVGPTLGGWLTDHWGWRWVFYVNMPVGALAIITAGLALPGRGQYREHSIDYLGAATLIGGTVPLLLAFSWAGSQYPWTSPQIAGLLAVAAVVLTAFVFVESRADEPIISPALFKNRIFTVSVAVTFLVSVAMFGTVLFLPLFIQAVIGTSATNSGAVLTPMMLGFIVSSITGGQIMARTGRYKALALTGCAVAAVGLFLLSHMTASASNGLVVRNMIVTGLGIGMLMSLFTIIVQNAFPFRQLGEVTATLAFFRSIGGTIGLAVLGSVMTSRFHSAFAADLPAALKQTIPPQQLAALQNPQVLLSAEAMARIQQPFQALGPQGQEVFTQLLAVLRQSLATAITDLFAVGMVLMVIAFTVTLFLREIPLRKGYFDEGVALPPERPLLTGQKKRLEAPSRWPILIPALSRAGGRPLFPSRETGRMRGLRPSSMGQQRGGGLSNTPTIEQGLRSPLSPGAAVAVLRR